MVTRDELHLDLGREVAVEICLVHIPPGQEPAVDPSLEIDEECNHKTNNILVEVIINHQWAMSLVTIPTHTIDTKRWKCPTTQYES